MIYKTVPVLKLGEELEQVKAALILIDDLDIFKDYFRIWKLKNPTQQRHSVLLHHLKNRLANCWVLSRGIHYH